MNNKIFYLIVGILILGAGYFSYVSHQDLGSAPSGLPATVASSSVLAVDTTAIEVLPTKPSCTSRVISTRASEIMIAFGEVGSYVVASTTIAQGIGHIQAASTTVAYDSGLYGCGKMSIFSYEAQRITVTELR